MMKATKRVEKTARLLKLNMDPELHPSVSQLQT